MKLYEMMIQQTTQELAHAKAALAQKQVEIHEAELEGLPHLVEGRKAVAVGYEIRITVLEKQLDKLWEEVAKQK